MSAIKFEEFGFKYRDGADDALTGIELEIEPGQIVLITGPSGAGKTTLCMALNGLVPQLHRGDMVGKVTIMGQFDNESEPVSVLSRTCGLLFQDPDTQLVAPTVRDEIAFGPENYCLPVEAIEAKVEELLDLTRMRKYVDRNPHYLSGGEKQACALAATLAMSPEILVLDEPTSNIDPVGTSVVFGLLQKLVSEDLTIVLVEHKLDELLEIVDRVIVVHTGQVVLDGKPRDIVEEERLLEDLGLSVPPVTVLMAKLRDHGFPVDHLPLTVDEAVGLARDILPGRDQVKKAAGKVPVPISSRVAGRGRPVISVQELCHTYDDGTEALCGISLDIREGEMTAILGQNGSGKTTLVKHFNGLLRPTAGSLQVMGKNAVGLKIVELASHVGYVFQDPDAQIFKERVREEIAYGPKNMGLPKEEVNRRVREAAEAIGISSLLDRNTFFLSKGEKQRVAVAGVLSMKPDIIVLDEPTTGQDEKGCHEIMRLAQELNRQGKTVVVITHNMALAAEYCERIVVLKDGKVLLDAPVGEAFAQDDVLAESALKSPQLMVFARQLAEYGFPPGFRTVAEAVDYFLNLRQVLS